MHKTIRCKNLNSLRKNRRFKRKNFSDTYALNKLYHLSKKSYRTYRIGKISNISPTKYAELEQINLKSAYDKEFKQILLFSLNYDSDGIAHELNSILSTFNQSCKFNTLSDFNNFFDDTNAIFRF